MLPFIKSSLKLILSFHLIPSWTRNSLRNQINIKFFFDINIKYIFFLSLLILLLSCSLDPVVIDPETLGDYYVFCTLSPGYSHQEILVGKSVPEDLPVAITDAEVTIRSDSQSVMFTHIKNGLYRDENNDLKLNPGSTYTLDIKLQNGEQITGETTLPGTFDILYPHDGDTVQHFLSRTLDTLLLAHVGWLQSERAKFYSVYLKIEDDLIAGNLVSTFRSDVIIPELTPRFLWTDTLKCEIMTPALLYIFAHDSTQRFPGYSRCFLDPYTDFTWKDLEDWIIGFEDRIQGFDADKIKLKGAIGVFNSIGMSKKEINLKVTIDWPGTEK